MSIDLSRRTFIGLLGSSLVAAYTAEWASIVESPPAGLDLRGAGERIIVHDITFDPRAGDRAIYATVSRDNGTVLLQYGLHGESLFRWCAVPGNEFIVPRGQALVFAPTTETAIWAIYARGEDGQPFMVRGRGGVMEPPVYLNDPIGARARRRLARGGPRYV